MTLHGPVLGLPVLSLWGSAGIALPLPVYGGAGATAGGYPHATLWSELACNGGTWLAVLPLVGCEVTQSIENNLVVRKLSVTVPAEWEDRALLRERRVVRLVFSAGTGAGAFYEYRITSKADASGKSSGGVISLRCVGPEFDLVERSQLVRRMVGTVAEYRYAAANLDISDQWTDHLSDAAPSYITLGTVTPVVTVDVTYDGDTCLSGLRRAVAEANRKTGVTYDIDVVRSGVVGYLVTVVEVGAGVAPDLRTGKNLVGLTRTSTAGTQTTRAQVVGSDGSGIGNNYWKVQAVSANVHIDVVDLNAGIGPAQEIDQYNTRYWVDAGGTAHHINDTAVVSTTVTRLLMSSTTGIAVDDWGRIAADASGNELEAVDAIADQATYGVVLGVLQSSLTRAVNILENPGFRTWGTPPPGWNVTGGGGVYVEETGAGLWLFGGRSLKLTIATMSPFNESVWQIKTGGEYVRWDCWVSVISSGGAAASMVTFQYEGGTIPGGSFDLNDYVGQGWVRLSRAAFCGAGLRTFRVSTQLAGVIYLAGAMVSTVSSENEEPPFMEGSGSAQMMQQAVAHLVENGAPPVAYEADILDLYRLDPLGIGEYEALTLGCTPTVTDTDLGVTVTPRVIEITERILANGQATPHDTMIRLATRKPSLTRYLVAA